MKPHDVNWLARTAVVVLFSAATLLFVRWIPDDAFISFRYAQNLADGAGLVFNTGDRVEGVSNPLWTAVLALLTRFGLDTVMTAVVLSLLCSVATVLLSFKLFDVVLYAGAPHANERRRFIGLKTAIAVGFAGSLPMIFYATSGLEAHAEVVLLLSAAIFHLEARSRGDGRLFAASQFTLLGVALLRPEGIMFLLLGAAFVALDCLRNSRGACPRTAAWIGVAVPLFVFVAALAVKAAYYGALLPNTYFAKPGVSIDYLTPLWRGLRYLIRFFLVSGLVLTLPFCAIAFADSRRRHTCIFLATFAAAQLAFIVLVGGDVLRFHRFTLPFTPFLLAISLVGFVRLDAMARVQSRWLSIGAAVICVVAMGGLNVGRVVLAQKKYCQHDWMHAQVHRQIGAFLREALPPGAAIVTNEVGALAYESGLVTHDMLGLTDATVSRILYESFQRYGRAGSPWSVPKIADYLMSRDPDCVVVPSHAEIDPDEHRPVHGRMHPIWEGLFTHPDLAERYHCGLCIRIHDGKYLYFYLRNEYGPDGTGDSSRPAGFSVPAPTPAPCMTVCEYTDSL
jgi:hypothetical protein